jgi:hypothetical protein
MKLPIFYGTRSFITVFTKSPPMDPILIQMNPVHTLLSYFSRYILILSSHLCMPSKRSLTLNFSDQNFICNSHCTSNILKLTIGFILWSRSKLNLRNATLWIQIRQKYPSKLFHYAHYSIIGSAAALKKHLQATLLTKENFYVLSETFISHFWT